MRLEVGTEGTEGHRQILMLCSELWLYCGGGWAGVDLIHRSWRLANEHLNIQYSTMNVCLIHFLCMMIKQTGKKRELKRRTKEEEKMK